MCNRTSNKIVEPTKTMISQDMQPNPEAGVRNPTTLAPAVAHSHASSASVVSTGSSSNGNSGLPAVETIREYDVLMGRGSGPNRHSGNIHFRAIVGEVFDEFLSKHGSDRTMVGDGGSDMMRIDPSTKNRLAQAVLDNITIKKNGRFLQKLNKKELSDAIKKGEDSSLIRARSYSLMDTAMATALARKVKAGTVEDNGNEKKEIDASAVVFYKIIPEKQILAKIKQTFRFLRDQNEASTVEKHRQNRKKAAVAGNQMATAQITAGMNGMQSQLPGGLGYLVDRFGVNGVNGLNVNASGLSNIINPINAGAVPFGNNTIKTLNNTNPQGATMDLASRFLCDLPQANRTLSASNGQAQQPLFQGSALAAGANQPNGNNDASTKRLLEQLTLSRLVNLQKQRDDTISAYLAHAAPGSAVAPNPTPALSGVGILQPSLQLQGLAAAQQPKFQNLLGSAVAPQMSANPDTLSLLLQLQQRQQQQQQR